MVLSGQIRTRLCNGTIISKDERTVNNASVMQGNHYKQR